MAADAEGLERTIGNLLRRIKDEGGAGGIHEPLRDVLEHIQHMPGVGGALLLSAWPRSTPESPVCSSAWDALALQDPDRLRSLARHLAQIKDVTYVERSAREPVPISWLAGALRKNDPSRFAVFPLRRFVPREFNAAPAFQMALVVAFLRPSAGEDLGPALTPYRQDLELLTWVLANLRINWEAPRLARRAMDLASTIDAGVTHILTETPPWLDAQAHFGQLVDNIRILMGCDTCQLYLSPTYASCLHDKDPERIWLVAEQVANREGLRCLRRDPSLVSYLWRRGVTAPLSIPNLLDNPNFRHHALSTLGLTRHFLGLLLTVPEPYEAIGVLVLRDKYARADDGCMCISTDGFSPEDVQRLEFRAAELLQLLKESRGDLGTTATRGHVGEAVDRLRRDLCGDTAQLYLTPEFIGRRRELPEDYMELYYHSRRTWLADAHYARGERLTGRVLAGTPVNEPDMFLWLSEQEAGGQAPASRRLGKYRLSQHFLAVPIPAPVAFRDEDRHPEAIGVLKVRDRLARDRVTLSAQGFSKEDEYLLQAFARMISVKIAIRAHLLRRESEQRAQSAGVAHAYRHDLTNLLRPALLRMRELPGNLDYLPRLLDRAGKMVDRSWKAARIAEGTHVPDADAVCDLTSLLHDLFPAEDACLAPQYGCDANLLIQAPHVPPESIWVRCDRTLLELAILVLPVWLHHHLDATTRADPQFQLKVSVSAERDEHGARLELVAPTTCEWPQSPDEDAARAGGDHLCYTNLLICPLIPWDALASEFRHYNATLDYRVEGGTTRAWVALTPAPPPGGRAAPTGDAVESTPHPTPVAEDQVSHT